MAECNFTEEPSLNDVRSEGGVEEVSPKADALFKVAWITFGESKLNADGGDVRCGKFCGRNIWMAPMKGNAIDKKAIPN